MGPVKKQFFPTSDRPELLEVQMPEGTAIERTSEAARGAVESWLRAAESRIVTTYIGQGAPRFYIPLSPELPDPPSPRSSCGPEGTGSRCAQAAPTPGGGQWPGPGARVRATQLVFGPPSPFPVAFRVNGPDLAKVRDIAASVEP
jgi:multidrug efflux pump subunit AcrB